MDVLPWGELNIVHLPSRGCCEEALLKNDEWFHGPNFLKENEENWPLAAFWM